MPDTTPSWPPFETARASGQLGVVSGFVDPGDWLEYKLDIGNAGDYQIQYRVASLFGSSGFNVLLDGAQIDSQTVPNTGGWQSWVTSTTTATVNLPAGEHTLRINAVGGGWNLNWIRFNL